MHRNIIQLAPKTFEQEWFYAVESFRLGNFEEALWRFELLAEKGVPDAYTEMGNLCELGYGLSAPDLDRARTWYENAIAAINCPHAHLGLGRVLLQKNDEGNLGRAVRHVAVAAQTGNPLALSLLGALHHDGHGVPRDLEVAAQYYEKAAAMGYLYPLFALSKLECDRGNWFKGVRLRVQATWRTICITAKDRSDPRLWSVGENRVKVKSKLR